MQRTIFVESETPERTAGTKSASSTQLVAASKSKSSPPAPADSLESLEAKVDTLCRAVEELRQIVCAQAMPTTAA